MSTGSKELWVRKLDILKWGKDGRGTKSFESIPHVRVTIKKAATLLIVLRRQCPKKLNIIITLFELVVIVSSHRRHIPA